MPKIPGPKGELIDGKELSFKTLHEDWNLYELEDGTKIRIKLVVAKIVRGIDPKTGDIYYLDNGEPFYSVRSGNIVVADVPDELMKPPKTSETS